MPAARSGEEETQALLPADSPSNLCGCSRDNPVRRRIYGLVTWEGFDYFILSVIVANCVMMAVDGPLEPEGTPKKALLSKLELIFNVIFTLELILKITGLGLLSYLSEGWNLLDVVVVSTAWLPRIFPTMGNYSAIRAVRVLRALRTVNRLPSLKKVIGTLLLAIPEVRARTSARRTGTRRRRQTARLGGRGGGIGAVAPVLRPPTPCGNCRARSRRGRPRHAPRSPASAWRRVRTHAYACVRVRVRTRAYACAHDRWTWPCARPPPTASARGCAGGEDGAHGSRESVAAQGGGEAAR